MKNLKSRDHLKQTIHVYLIYKLHPLLKNICLPQHPRIIDMFNEDTYFHQKNLLTFHHQMEALKNLGKYFP